MTAVREAGAPAPGGVLSRLLHRTRRALDPQQLLFSKYKLTKRERGEMVVRAAAFTQVASPVGSAFYYLVLQRFWGYRDPHGNWVTYWGLKDTYDRLPIHLQNLALHLGIPVHVFHSQAAPSWWVVARHDGRHFLIGLVVALMVGSLTIGLSNKPRKRVSNRMLPVRFVLAFLSAVPVAAIGIGFFAWFLPHVAGWDVSQVGVGMGGWFGEWFGKGNWQLTIIGVLTGLAMRPVLKPAQDTLQLISMEKKLTDRQEPKKWWHLAFGINYVKRYEYLQATNHQCEKHGTLMGTLMVLSAPVFLAMFGFGFWLLYLSGIVTGH